MPQRARQGRRWALLALELVGGAVVLIGLALVLGRRLPMLDDEPDDAPDPGLPEGRLLRSSDIPRLRFRLAFRGYRMADVDAALEAVRLALATHDGEEPVLADQPVHGEDESLSQLEDAQRQPADDSS